MESIPGVDLVVDSKGLFGFLLWGKVPAGFDPQEPGLVLFLGGDLTYAMFLGEKVALSINCVYRRDCQLDQLGSVCGSL